MIGVDASHIRKVICICYVANLACFLHPFGSSLWVFTQGARVDNNRSTGSGLGCFDVSPCSIKISKVVGRKINSAHFCKSEIRKYDLVASLFSHQ